jgi:hypothetical protein
VYETERIVKLRLYPPIKLLIQDELIANPLLPLCFIHVVLRNGYSAVQGSAANIQRGLTGTENLSARFALANNLL